MNGTSGEDTADAFLTNRMPVQAIEILIEHGAELEAQDKLGETPLKKAVKFKQVDAILMLIEAGAELDSPLGILATAWNAARTDKKLADFSTCNKRSGSPFVDNGRAKLC